jgi:hypothetical protein
MVTGFRDTGNVNDKQHVRCSVALVCGTLRSAEETPASLICEKIVRCSVALACGTLRSAEGTPASLICEKIVTACWMISDKCTSSDQPPEIRRSDFNQCTSCSTGTAEQDFSIATGSFHLLRRNYCVGGFHVPDGCT